MSPGKRFSTSLSTLRELDITLMTLSLLFTGIGHGIKLYQTVDGGVRRCLGVRRLR
jgi:hypothetical protein